MPDDPTPKRSPGRPYGSSELLEVKGPMLLAFIRRGRMPATARARVGLEAETVRRWIDKGEDAERLLRRGAPLSDGEEKYRQFLWDYRRACRTLQGKLEERLADLADTMEASEILKVLERLDREVWGRHDTITVQDGSTDDDVIRRWAETLGYVIRRVLDAAHLSDEQQAQAQAELDAALADVSVGDDDEAEV